MVEPLTVGSKSQRLHFPDVYGQTAAHTFLERACVHNRLSHSYLFAGPPGVGKHATAMVFAQALLCEGGFPRPCRKCRHCRLFLARSHPNMVILIPHPRTAKESDLASVLESFYTQPYEIRRPWAAPALSIESVRALRRDLALTSAGGQNRVAVISDAHTMTAEAANALLKTLEEPPAHSYFILISDSPDQLLPTILSRCQIVRFSGVPEEQVERALQEKLHIDEPLLRRQIARLAHGNIARAFQLAREDVTGLRQVAVELLRCAFRTPSQRATYVQELVQNYDRKVLRDFLENMLLWIRDAFQVATSTSAHLETIPDRETLQRFVDHYPDFAYDRALADIDRSIHMLERYVQPLLVLNVLLIRLRRYAQGQQAKRGLA